VDPIVPEKEKLDAFAPGSVRKKVDSGALSGIVCRLFLEADRHDLVTGGFYRKRKRPLPMT
jgi:hypothetical protein